MVSKMLWIDYWQLSLLVLDDLIDWGLIEYCDLGLLILLVELLYIYVIIFIMFSYYFLFIYFSMKKAED